MEIKKIGTEMPISNALSLYLLNNGGERKVLVDEYRKLLKDICLKLSLIINSGSVRKASEILNGILSLGLLIKTNGSQDPELMAFEISRNKLTGLVRIAIDAVKIYTEKYNYNFRLFDESLNLSKPDYASKSIDMLIMFADSKENNIWNGYKRYVNDLERVSEEIAYFELAKWLKEYCRKSSEVAEFTNPEIEPYLGANELTSIILLRLATGKKPSPTISRKGILDIRSKLKGKVEYEQSIKKRLKHFISLIPKELRSKIDINSFFIYYLKPIIQNGDIKNVEKLLDVY